MRTSPRFALIAPLLAVAGGTLVVIGAFLAWLTTATDTGGQTSISGFGDISGNSPLAGTNLNDLLSVGGLSSFRPGWPGLIGGTVAVLIGIAAAVVSPAARRAVCVLATLLGALGVLGLGWGVLRGLAPGTGGVLAGSEGHTGSGPWSTAAGGALLVAAGCWLLKDSTAKTIGTTHRHRGIQR